MAKAIIHNSNYQSVDECKGAIDRYFAERNQAFIENPKRAGIIGRLCFLEMYAEQVAQLDHLLLCGIQVLEF